MVRNYERQDTAALYISLVLVLRTIINYGKIVHNSATMQKVCKSYFDEWIWVENYATMAITMLMWTIISVEQFMTM